MTATRSRRVLPTLAVLTGCVVASACGVPTGGDTRVIETQNVPYGLLRDTEPTTTGAARASTEPGEVQGQIALLADDNAVRLVPRDVDSGGAPTRIAGLLLQELQHGPTDAERHSGLRSAVSASLQLQVTGWRRGVLSLDVSSESNPGSDRLPLAIAQIVLTATSTPGVQAVLFQHDDTTVQVPLVDGSLTSTALTRQDYQHLLDAPSAPAEPVPTTRPR